MDDYNRIFITLGSFIACPALSTSDCNSSVAIGLNYPSIGTFIFHWHLRFVFSLQLLHVQHLAKWIEW